jgi:hypothetical protein
MYFNIHVLNMQTKPGTTAIIPNTEEVTNTIKFIKKYFEFKKYEAPMIRRDAS